MENFNKLNGLEQIPVLICFYDIANFTSISKKLNNLDGFQFFQDLSKIIHNNILKTSGMIIKYIGDAGLIIFPDDKVDEGISSLVIIQEELHRFLKNKQFTNKIKFSCHFGDVAIGKLDPFDSFDIIGDAVNIAATLFKGNPRSEFVISPQAFRKLSKENRTVFHKFTQPIVYCLGK